MPVSVDPLSEFIASSHLVMEDNFGALMLCLGAMVSMLNYQGVKETVGHFNTPLCYGPPMAGKTLAATCVALVLGMNKNQISSRYVHMSKEV